MLPYRTVGNCDFKFLSSVRVVGPNKSAPATIQASSSARTGRTFVWSRPSLMAEDASFESRAPRNTLVFSLNDFDFPGNTCYWLMAARFVCAVNRMLHLCDPLAANP